VRLPGDTVTLQAAVDAFLEHHDLAPSTRRVWVYRASLASFVAELGPTTAVRELSGPALAAWFRHHYAAAAPATWNRELATLQTAVGWWRRRGWLIADLTGVSWSAAGSGLTHPGRHPRSELSAPSSRVAAGDVPCNCLRPRASVALQGTH
jgi:hypothetical protein